MRRGAFTLSLVLASGAAHAEPPLAEFAGGAIPDDQRAALKEAFYEEVPLLGEKALSPRAAGITKLKMDAVVQRFPQSAAAQKYLGRACHATGDVTCAERAYREAVQQSSSAPWALSELADFFASRNQPKDELQTLDKLADARKPTAVGPAATTDGRTALRETYERARDVAAAHQATGTKEMDPARYQRLIVELYPDDPSYLRRYVDGLIAAGRPGDALAEVQRYKKRYPKELRYFAQVESEVAEAKRDGARAEAVYTAILAKGPMGVVDADGLYDDYLDLEKRLGHLREQKRALSAKARAGRIAGFDLSLLVHLLVHEGDRDPAKKVLDAQAAQPGSASELILRARLYGTLGAPDLAVPLYYAASRKGGGKERIEALGALGLQLTSGDVGRTGLTPLGALDGFKLHHVAAGPSIAGGLASMVFNGARGQAGADLEQVEAAYGNGARAQAVLVELRKIAPKAPETAELLRALVGFRRAYLDHADAVKLVDEFQRSFPRHPGYFDVARDGCDSRWRLKEGGAPCYVKLLDDASKRGDSREYFATLRALSSAAEAEKKTVELLKIYWAELGKHPADSQLYDRFLEHLASHNLYDEELKVYQEGVKRFATSAWYDRLARWHLRHKGKAAFRTLTEQLLSTVDDSIAEEYLGSQVDWSSRDSDSQVFYEAMYRHALDRFPLDERFALKLIAFYNRSESYDEARATALTKRYSFFDADLRNRLIVQLAGPGVGALEQAVAPGGKPLAANPAQLELSANALVFLSRQEEAEPLLAQLVSAYPADVPLLRRHAALTRALAKPSSRAAATDAAHQLDGLCKLFPADESLATEAGDYLSEAGEFDEASRRYEKIIAMRPGDAEAYLRLASIDWDYFHFDAAAQAIARARKQSGDPLKFADKLAAVYESKKDYPSAIGEYVRLVVGTQKLDQHTRAPRYDEERDGGDEGEGEGRWHGDDVGPADPGAGAALSRLAYLSKKKGLAGAIDKAWKARLGGDGRAVLGYAAYLAEIGDDEARGKLLAREAAKTTDFRLLERIIDDRRGASDDTPGALIAALQREAELGKGAPSYVYPLVDALQAAERDADAERELKALTARLDAGGEDDREEAIAAWIARADFSWKRERWNDAIAAKDAAADRARDERQIELRLESIAWRGERGKLDEAEKIARALLDKHPGEVRFAQPVAEVLWKKGQRDQAIELYRAQMGEVKKLKLPTEPARAMVMALRHQLVEKLDQAGKPRDALEEWFEIVNKAPDDRAQLGQLHDYAVKHGLTKRLGDYYWKTAKASPKDYRWPVVLSVLADLDGDPAGQASRLAEALAVAPEKQDLLRERAEALARAGDPNGAAAAYHRLWELADHDSRWAVQEAVMLARAGKRDAAVAAIKRLVEGDPPDPAIWIRAADLLEKAGLVDDAWAMADRALAKGRADLRGHSFDRSAAVTYARLAVRTGRATDGWRALMQLEDKARAEAGTEGNPEPWRASSTSDACGSAANDDLPKAVAEYANDADARRFADAVRAKAQGTDGIERMLRVAESAGRPDLAREVMRRGVQLGGNVGESWAGRLLADYEAAGQWALVVKLSRDEHLASERDLTAEARACRMLGDPCEREALAAYVAAPHRYGDPLQWRFGDHDPLLARYLDLLTAGKREAELKALADRGTYHADQIADYLFAHGRPDLGRAAIVAAGRPESTSWRGGKQAVALLALGGHGGEARDLIAPLLALSPIGRSLGHKPDADKELISRRWFHYAERYGDALQQAGQKDDARRWSAATVEDRPLEASAYLAQGAALERIGDHGQAQGAIERALTLAPTSRAAFDALAKSRLAAGDKRGALAAWDRVLGKSPSDSTQRARYDLVRAAGLTDEARAPYAEWIASRWKKHAVAPLADLGALAETYRNHGAGSEWEKYLRGLLDQSGWKDGALLGAMAGKAGEPLLDAAAREPYLRYQVDHPANPQLKWGALQALADWALEQKRWEVALDAAKQSWPKLEVAPPEWVVPLKAQALAGKGDPHGAELALVEWGMRFPTDEIRERAAAGLDALKSPAAWDLRLALARDKVARPDHGAGDDAALAEALLHKGGRDEAQSVLRKLAVKRLDDADGIRLGAEVAERWKMAALARDLRRRMQAIDPRDGENLVALAADERDAGSPDKAVQLVAQVLSDRAAKSAARRGAGALLGELGRAKAPGAKDALSAAPKDEPGAIARAVYDDDPGQLASQVDGLAAPRDAERRLAVWAAQKGKHADAAKWTARLRNLGVADDELRRIALTEERLAGHPAAALDALGDGERARWVESVATTRRELGPGAERQLQAIVETRRAQLAKLPNGARVADEALHAAADSGDLPSRAFYAAVADALAPSDAGKRRARDLRAQVDAARKLEARRFLTQSIDDFSVLADAKGGRR